MSHERVNCWLGKTKKNSITILNKLQSFIFSSFSLIFIYLFRATVKELEFNWRMDDSKLFPYFIIWCSKVLCYLKHCDIILWNSDIFISMRWAVNWYGKACKIFMSRQLLTINSYFSFSIKQSTSNNESHKQIRQTT